MEEIVFGVIVTFNRKGLLLQNIKAHESQLKKLDKIIVIDNGGTDNTLEFLKENNVDLNWIEYIYLEKNIGCAGAFAKGIDLAFSSGADWVYVMDDDGRPWNESTILNLMTKLKNEKLDSSKTVLANSLVQISDETLSFKLFESFDKTYCLRRSHNGIINFQAKLWNGSLISKGLYNKIGGPNAEFGFKGEEIDFKKRALVNGAFVLTIVDSLYYHPQIKENHIRFLWKNEYFSFEPNWKYYYTVRNRIYMLLMEKRRFRAILFYIKFYLCAKKLCNKENWELTKKTIRIAKMDGFNKKLGLIDFESYIEKRGLK